MSIHQIGSVHLVVLPLEFNRRAIEEMLIHMIDMEKMLFRVRVEGLEKSGTNF